MIEFLKKGKELGGVKMGMTVDVIRQILGKPDEIVGTSECGYLHYNDYRYGYDESGCIKEISIEFIDLNKKYRFEDIEYKKYDISFHESFVIKRKTKMHKFLRFLNYLKLEWTIHSKNIDDISIKINNGPFVVFNLKTGFIYRISVVDGYQDNESTVFSS